MSPQLMPRKKAAAPQKERKSSLVVTEDEDTSTVADNEMEEFIDSESKSGAPTESEVTESEVTTSSETTEDEDEVSVDDEGEEDEEDLHQERCVADHLDEGPHDGMADPALAAQHGDTCDPDHQGQRHAGQQHGDAGEEQRGR